jgi:hypothetical protein
MDSKKKKAVATRPRQPAKGGISMKQDESKMMLTAVDIKSMQPAQSAAVAEFLDPEKPRANVRGIALGVKWTEWANPQASQLCCYW